MIEAHTIINFNYFYFMKTKICPYCGRIIVGKQRPESDGHGNIEKSLDFTCSCWSAWVLKPQN